MSAALAGDGRTCDAYKGIGADERRNRRISSRCQAARWRRLRASSSKKPPSCRNEGNVTPARRLPSSSSILGGAELVSRIVLRRSILSRNFSLARWPRPGRRVHPAWREISSPCGEEIRIGRGGGDSAAAARPSPAWQAWRLRRAKTASRKSGGGIAAGNGGGDRRRSARRPGASSVNECHSVIKVKKLAASRIAALARGASGAMARAAWHIAGK